MKNKDQLKLVVNNFRAVGKAEIALNGITVVAGENGSGKSTLSKLLYHIIDDSIDYDNLVQYGSLLPSVSKLFGVIDEMNDVLDYYKRRVNKNDIFSTTSIRDILSHDSLFEDEFNIIEYLDYLDSIFAERCALFENRVSKGRLNKIIEITKSVLNTKNITTVNDCIRLIRRDIISNFESNRKKISDRPITVMMTRLNYIFQDNGISINSLNLQEYGVNILDFPDRRVGKIASINNVTYVYTPFAFDFMDILERTARLRYSNTPKEAEYILDLSNKVKHEFKSNQDLNLSNEISAIIGGRVFYEKQISKRGFWFQQDGMPEPFKLADCATGIKSFAVLQLLIDNDCVNENTILILDEPETHLHPQWIVEYARMIVMLNKDVGVKFFIASHNHDMVDAINSISQREGVIDTTRFYLAEKSGDKYNFTDLNIKPKEIHKSFNTAFNKIAGYGVQN